VIVSCDVGVTCDILDESFYKPIVVAPTNPSCSTFTSTSPLSDGFTCDASLMVKNETLKKEVNELTLALGNAYGGDAHLLKCLGSQRFSLNKERLGYIPKKDKAAFVTCSTNTLRRCVQCAWCLPPWSASISPVGKHSRRGSSARRGGRRHRDGCLPVAFSLAW
jgi:hypothetical protein